MTQNSQTKTVKDSSIDSHVYKIFPNDLNAHGTAFGGMIMAKCDRLSLVAAERHSGMVCVTASVDSIHFRAPAKENDTLLFKVSVNRAWNSSMEVGVRVDAENSYNRESRHILSAYFTFVALDPEGRPALVPQLDTETPEQARRFEQAGIRRKGRLETKEALQGYQQK